MTFSNIIVNDLPEISLIAGNQTELDFTVYTEINSFANLSDADIVWKLAPYGSTGSVVQLNGVISGSPGNGEFTVLLSHENTSSLAGKYIQQFTITTSGSIYTPSQGIINIIPLIT